MAVAITPRPQDGPLDSKQPRQPFTVSVPAIATLHATLVLPDGSVVRLETALLIPGTNRLTLYLPAGIPAGTVLKVQVSDLATGQKQSFTYGIR